MGYTVNGKEYDYFSSTNQDILRKLVNREVCACISDMAEHLFSYDDDTYDVWDNWENLTYEACPHCGEALDDDTCDLLNSGEEAVCSWCEEVIDSADTRQAEIYEYWIVTPWFGEKLAAHGEPIYNRWGGDIWGRCTTGQSMVLDYVIAQIAHELGILEGQEHDWSR